MVLLELGQEATPQSPAPATIGIAEIAKAAGVPVATAANSLFSAVTCSYLGVPLAMYSRLTGEDVPIDQFGDREDELVVRCDELANLLSRYRQDNFKTLRRA